MPALEGLYRYSLLVIAGPLLYLQPVSLYLEGLYRYSLLVIIGPLLYL